MLQEYNDVLQKLHDYMLDENNIKKSLMMKINLNNTIKEKSNKMLHANKEYDEKHEIFVPVEQDSLFWCYFIMKNGDIKYETIYNKNDLVAKQMKIDLVNVVRKNKDIVKMYKLDTITNIECNLANDNLLNSKTFLTLCAIENINVIYVSKKTYFDLMMNDTDIVYIIYERPSKSKYYNKYGYELGNKSSIENIRTTLYKVDKIDKPIRSLSYYKVEELLVICDKLVIETYHLNTGKTKSKKDLYEAIIQYF
uniref:Uncharacterized protein n=1 Tax=viral metagenome TaxID=1070528 RepID=A0A6C0AS09_9ZZZZ